MTDDKTAQAAPAPPEKTKSEAFDLKAILSPTTTSPTSPTSPTSTTGRRSLFRS